ncbi:MAG: pyridoxamine 5'-phosphate oxidase family protein [Nitrosarchaeum sp.]|jgi:predicted pyridoxine 5'-phosphate oxidase superfamily flavin-nucleotide-binding protein|uniref:pyridoxamine 5'-phosphate oxidase family protein n=1 Tax=Nitrosarchaeum sp. TaxID=2026886 RepID=UPI002DF63CB0|nr:pyridoxamine 5'-phosphate oxidase family protein [Nitrosarchaeum sp.]
MITIPNEIKEFIEIQGIFAVGTIGVNNIPNISPRIFFRVDQNTIYWLDFFKHKSYKNIQANPWVTISVFNKDDLKGFQFRGIVNFITDEPIKSEIKESIIKKTLEKNSSEKIKKLSEKIEVQVIRFEPKVCYSLNPDEFSDMCIGSDVDSTQLFQK